MEFIKILGGLLTPIIAGLALYIAWQQKKIAIDKLKFDLFERRYAIYKIVNDYMLQLLKDTSTAFNDDGQMMDYRYYVNFNYNTKEAAFLFDKDVTTYLEDVRDQSLKLISAYNALKNRSNFPMYSLERNEKLDDFKRITTWLDKEVLLLEGHFEKYLGFKHLK